MTPYQPLPRSFFEPSAEVVAPALLGHWLICRTPFGAAGGPIVETEAYLYDDPACHAAPGLTTRNRVMFGPPGYAYVYLIYGFHFCVNAVCQRAGIAEAVLIRAIEPVIGPEHMHARRPAPGKVELTNGPGKLCQALGIDRKLDGVDLCDSNSPLVIAENPDWRGFHRRLGPVRTTRRIGITRAADLPLRFYLEASEYVSQRKRGRKRKDL